MPSIYELGMSIERAELFGKPHITNDGLCVICGRMANNHHHIAPKGMGGGSKYLEIGGKKLESSLIDVCGMGNASGCHGLFHAGDIYARWVWYDQKHQQEWFSGEFFTDYGIRPYSSDLYNYGYWVITTDKWEREIHG